MYIIDSSAWIEFFRNGKPDVVAKVDDCLGRDLVAIGDLIYCEVIQGIRSPEERAEVSAMLLSQPQFEMVGFAIAEAAAANFRLLRSRGVNSKTIDVIIATFCVEHGFRLIHADSDFDLMARHIGLRIG
jgi:predicted nucleic acid-binding protein